MKCTLNLTLPLEYIVKYCGVKWTVVKYGEMLLQSYTNVTQMSYLSDCITLYLTTREEPWPRLAAISTSCSLLLVPFFSQSVMDPNSEIMTLSLLRPITYNTKLS